MKFGTKNPENHRILKIVFKTGKAVRGASVASGKAF